MKYSSVKRNIGVIVFYILLTVVMTYPWSAQLSSTITTGGDTYFNIWTIAWDVHMFQENPLDVFNANIFHPNENTLAYSEHLIGTALVAWPIIALTGNPVLAYNIIIFVFFVLAGYCMYLLAYFFTKNISISLLGGIIYGFNAYMFLHFNLLHITAAFFFPLMFLILHKLVASEKRLKYFSLFTLICIVLGYMSGYFFMMMAVIVPIFFIIHFTAVVKKLPDKKFVTKFVISLFIIILVVLPVYYPYLSLRDETGYNRSYAMVNHYSPTVIDYLTFSPLLMGLFELPKTIFKTYIYTGFTVFFLFVFSIVMFFKKYYKQKHILNKYVLYLSIGVVCFLLSFGVVIRFSETDNGIIGPFIFLFEFVPGFSSLRAIGRFFIVTLMSMTVLITIALHQYLRKIKKRSLYVGIISLLSSLIVLEYLIIPPLKPISLEAAKIGSDIPDVYQWLAEKESDIVILELPLWVGEEAQSSKYLYFSIYHWKKLINGYSGYYPPDYVEFSEKSLKDILKDDTIKEIKDYGVDYVIIHTNASPGLMQELKEYDLENNEYLILEEKFDYDHVYQLR